ncbi:helix-turn-helix domain-containing protein [Nonomuraea lactucae]|uniref:helix-turn-helix domain-containing protein n=1 Tax=Nonomuraea lactucae TaxID=2249762 RepID=UPI0013B3E31E|nr:helix-turn-helix transcriptional regulator [Nonomuraea lactucae]
MEARDTSARMFGLVLAHLRRSAGLSQRELSRLAHYDHTRISRCEKGETLPPVEHAEALGRALGAGDLLLALRSAAVDGSAVLLPTNVPGGIDGEPVMLDMLTPEGRSVRVTLSRRLFAQLLAGGALSSILPGLGDSDQLARVTEAIARPARVDAQVIGYFRRVLAEHYAADKMLGPRSLLRPVLAQVQVLDELRRGAKAAYADPLLQVLSQYAEMAGWLHQDLGELESAMSWTRRAAEWAQCAGDVQMAAYMLVRQSNIAALTDDYAGVVQLAAAARRNPAGLEPKLTALAAQQQARGLAMLGEHHECFALLDEAAGALHDHPHVTHPEVPVYLHHYNVDTLREQSAVCYRAAGRPDTAAAILEAQIGKLPTTLSRDRGYLTAKLAVAVIQAEQDPARGAHLGQQALDIARQTSSARIHRELRTLDSELQKRWSGHADAVAFHDALTAA